MKIRRNRTRTVIVTEIVEPSVEDTMETLRRSQLEFEGRSSEARRDLTRETVAPRSFPTWAVAS